MDELRRFLAAAYDRPFGWAVRGVAARALTRLVGAADVDWVLDLYFGVEDALEKHELVPVVLALPPEAARARLVAELSSPDPLNRQAAVKAIGNMAFPDRCELLSVLRDDPDSFVSRSATFLARQT